LLERRALHAAGDVGDEHDVAADRVAARDLVLGRDDQHERAVFAWLAVTDHAQRVVAALHAVAQQQVVVAAQHVRVELGLHVVLGQPLHVRRHAVHAHVGQRQLVADLGVEAEAAARRQVPARQHVLDQTVAHRERGDRAQLDALVLARREREHAEAKHVAVLLEDAGVAALHLGQVLVDLARDLPLEHLADDLLAAVPVAEAVDQLVRADAQLAGQLERGAVLVLKAIRQLGRRDLVVHRDLGALVHLHHRPVRRRLPLLIDRHAVERERPLRNRDQEQERRIEANPSTPLHREHDQALRFEMRRP
jgi:hypothetical protein